ncbi:MAG: LysM peptidoglycan-binding domain-containing protein, partial [Neisseria sp.]|nr:LysM peptidoglycan-binding domain-containing protein [Neisseria sp.]
MKYSVFSLKAVVLAAAVGLLSACAGSASTGPVPEGHYRVQPGDNLYRIGLRFGQSVNTLARWNNLRDASQIEVGQVLRVRSGSSSSASRSTSSSGSRTATTVAPVNRLNMQWPVAEGSRNIIANYNGTTNKGIDIGGTR